MNLQFALGFIKVKLIQPWLSLCLSLFDEAVPIAYFDVSELLKLILLTCLDMNEPIMAEMNVEAKMHTCKPTCKKTFLPT